MNRFIASLLPAGNVPFALRRLSEVGQIAFRYAEEIFGLGREMTHAIHGWRTTGPQLPHVGVADAVPKPAATLLLAPATRRYPDMRLICREDQPDRLLTELATHFEES